jgi:type I restriction enzyme M protein
LKDHPIMPRGRSKKSASDAPPSAKVAKPEKSNGNGGNLGFEAQLFLAADKLRKNLEPSDHKHVALGLIFLKYISNAFEAKRAALLAEDPVAAEDPELRPCSGCRRWRAGHTCKPTPSNPPSVS